MHWSNLEISIDLIKLIAVEAGEDFLKFVCRIFTEVIKFKRVRTFHIVSLLSLLTCQAFVLPAL